jgi:alpha-mannosidase
VDEPNVIVEVVKQADRNGATIIRLYESWGSRGPAHLRFGFPVTRAARVDLLERELGLGPLPVDVDGSQPVVRLDVKPFEIVTISLERD